MSNKKAMGQLGADRPASESATTIVGGQPMRRRFQRVGVPAGVEQALFLAATDEAFHADFIHDREAAVKKRGLELTPSELAMLRLAPTEQLEATIASLDTSPPSLERRSFMRAVAVSAAALAAGAGCSDNDVETDAPVTYYDAGVTADIPQVYPDAGVTTDVPNAVVDIGILADIPVGPDSTGILADMPAMKDGGPAKPGDGE